MLSTALQFLLNLALKQKLLIIISIFLSIFKNFFDLIVIGFFGLLIGLINDASDVKNFINKINFIKENNLADLIEQNIFYIFIILFFVKIVIDLSKAYFVNYSGYDCWKFLNTRILRNAGKSSMQKDKLFTLESIILSETYDFVNTLYMPFCSLIGEISLIILFIIFTNILIGINSVTFLIIVIPTVLIFLSVFHIYKKKLFNYSQKSIFFRKVIGRKINLLLSSLPDLKILNANSERTSFYNELENLKKSYFKVNFFKESLTYFYENLFISIVVLVIFIVNFNSDFTGNITGVFILMIIAFIRIGPSLNRSMTAVNNCYQGLIKLKNFSQFLKQQTNYNPYIESYKLNKLILIISGNGFKFIKKIFYKNKYKFFVGINKIVGKNGSGKSTLLNIIMGINYGFKTSISLPNKNIGYLNQTSFNFCQKVKEEILIFKNKNLSNRKLNLINSLLKINKISINSLIDNLSGGQKQIVSLCRIIAQDSNLIILDEPFNSLDKRNIVKFSKIFKEMSKNKIIILVDHLNILKEDNSIFLGKDKV